MKLQILCTYDAAQSAAGQTAKALSLTLNQVDESAEYTLNFSKRGVELLPTNTKRHGAIRVDFCEGKAAHRRQYGGGKGQLIAKACGIKKYLPSIFDATAGLGQDAFVLATLGCHVTMLERSPVAYALLEDGLRRATDFAVDHDPTLQSILDRLTLLPSDAIHYMQTQSGPVADVVYLDPMFPDKTKKAAVNKGMQAFHNLIGKDADDAKLLAAALKVANYRVVVKRPRLAPCISGEAPNHQVLGKSSRYDIYTLKALPTNLP